MNFNFDEIISAPCRLSILATLVPGEAVSFTKMKAATSLSDGNLHVQTRKLADAGYIEINKIKKGKRTVTEFRITGQGRERLRLHVVKLQKILDADAGAKPPPPNPLKPRQRSTRTKQRAARPDDSAVWA
jgi:DNA-binding PadR family transcriptional regulator